MQYILNLEYIVEAFVYVGNNGHFIIRVLIILFYLTDILSDNEYSHYPALKINRVPLYLRSLQ